MSPSSGTLRRGHESDVPLPAGFGVALARDVIEVEPGVWLGGRPTRALRLTDAGRQAWDDVLSSTVIGDRTGGLVARRFVDAGLADPLPPPLAATPDLTVVVPVRDRPVELSRCLAALGTARDVVVVDDASADAGIVVRIAAAHGARVVRLDVNGGPGVARNAGLAHVHTDLVAFVDSDTTPSPTSLRELAAHLADPLVAAAAPRVIGAGGPTAAARYARDRNSLDLGAVAAGVRPYTPVPYVPTATLVARTTALRTIADGADVFDPALRHGEDVDVIWRLLAAGLRVRFVPDVIVTHHDPSTWRGLLGRRFRYGTSAGPLSRKHPDHMAPLVVHPWHGSAVAALLSRRPAVALLATAGALATGRRRACAAGLSPRCAPPALILRASLQTLLAVATYARTFALPALGLALLRPQTRPAALVLLLAPAARDWRERRPRLDPVRFCVAAIADDFAYGAGVLAGCLAHRTTVPLRPVRARSARTR